MHLANPRACRLGATLCMLAVVASAAQAQSVQPAQIGRTQEQTRQSSRSERLVTELDARDRLVAEIWGLSTEEMVRAKVLMQGPRAAFSVPNLSPVEALGIHARNDAERRKYAEMFARAFHADVERSLVWNSAYQDAITRLYPHDQVINYSGLPKVAAPIGAADAMNVPRSQIIDASAPPARGASKR